MSIVITPGVAAIVSEAIGKMPAQRPTRRSINESDTDGER